MALLHVWLTPYGDACITCVVFLRAHVCAHESSVVSAVLWLPRMPPAASPNTPPLQHVLPQPSSRPAAQLSSFPRSELLRRLQPWPSTLSLATTSQVCRLPQRCRSMKALLLLCTPLA
jgi:hypothetical protein